MKKRIFLVLVFAALTGGGLFAQNHFISAEISFIGVGGRYEYVITPYLTVGAYVYYNFMPTPFLPEDYSSEHSIFAAGIAGRWYPAGRRFFFEIDLGFSEFMSTRLVEIWYGYNLYDSYLVHDIYSGFCISPGFGWTIDVGKPGGFFISPGAKFPFTFSDSDKGPFDDGVMPSVVVYFGLGYAF
ncbi:hypothetical protein AGMMS49928_10230 [Spirochaetia bacterium]|nr:hypothetical protein AGMMS49928_10230 [Spirochaetia bacterium]